MKTIIFFLEELSAKVMLQGLLPRILPDGIQCRFVVFEGKQDLEKNLVKRLRGWLLELNASHSFSILVEGIRRLVNSSTTSA